MDIRHLHTLITVAEADSFAHAAELLFITPAAVSQQVRQLERELGIDLFDRSLRPPRLNSNCEALVGRAKELVEQFNNFKSSVSESTVRGRLTIGSVNGITDTLLPKTLRSLRQRYPELRVRIQEGESQLLTRRVIRKELDAAIVSDVMKLPDTMEHIPIFSEPLVVITEQINNPESWRDAIENNFFLRLNRNASLGSLIDHSLKNFQVKVEEAMELDSTDSIVQMTLAGLGSAVVPMGRVSSEACRSLRVFPFGDPQVHRHAGLVHRKNAKTPELLKLLYQELQSHLF